MTLPQVLIFRAAFQKSAAKCRSFSNFSTTTFRFALLSTGGCVGGVPCFGDISLMSNTLGDVGLELAIVGLCCLTRCSELLDLQGNMTTHSGIPLKRLFTRGLSEGHPKFLNGEYSVLIALTD